MKKILIIGLTNGVGGVETFIVNMIKNIDSKKYYVECLVHQDVNEYYLNDLSNIKIKKITGIKENIFKFLKEIIEYYKENEFDIIHINECSAWFFIYALPVWFNRKIKIIIHSHNGSGENVLLHKIFRFIQLCCTNINWACSEKAGKWMFKNHKYEIINNGIDLSNYRFDINIKKKKMIELGLEDKIIIGSVARLETQKNHKKILSIFKYYYENINNNSVLVLIGDGKEKDNILKLIDDLNLKESVKLLGLRKDVNDLLKMFDILLMPSLYEGFPFVTIEAQAASLPVLLSNTITSQVQITDLINMCNLEESDEIWARKVNELIYKFYDNRNSNKYIDTLKNFGFDFKNIMQEIMQKYENM